jgi:hypothetical protein
MNLFIWLVTGGLLLVLGFVLVLRFLNSRNIAYLVLAVPLVLWPFVWWPFNWLLTQQLNRNIRGEGMLWPWSILNGSSLEEIVSATNFVRHAIELTLLIIGFILLGRSRAGAEHPQLGSRLQAPPVQDYPAGEHGIH